ncbi:MAG: hypothetical protein WDM85_04025 [Caulobacteraceae bacterium]
MLQFSRPRVLVFVELPEPGRVGVQRDPDGHLDVEQHGAPLDDLADAGSSPHGRVGFDGVTLRGRLGDRLSDEGLAS